MGCMCCPECITIPKLHSRDRDSLIPIGNELYSRVSTNNKSYVGVVDFPKTTNSELEKSMTTAENDSTSPSEYMEIEAVGNPEDSSSSMQMEEARADRQDSVRSNSSSISNLTSRQIESHHTSPDNSYCSSECSTATTVYSPITCKAASLQKGKEARPQSSHLQKEEKQGSMKYRILQDVRSAKL